MSEKCEVKNVSELMKKKAAEYDKLSAGGKFVIAERLISQNSQMPESDYSFCPYCAVRMRRSYPADWKQYAKPLISMRYKLLLRISSETGRIAYETRWYCPTCKRNITEDDFIAVYCKPYEQQESPIVDLRKVNVNDPDFARCF